MKFRKWLNLTKEILKEKEIVYEKKDLENYMRNNNKAIGFRKYWTKLKYFHLWRDNVKVLLRQKHMAFEKFQAEQKAMNYLNNIKKKQLDLKSKKIMNKVREDISSNPLSTPQPNNNTRRDSVSRPTTSSSSRTSSTINTSKTVKRSNSNVKAKIDTGLRNNNNTTMKRRASSVIPSRSEQTPQRSVPKPNISVSINRKSNINNTNSKHINDKTIQQQSPPPPINNPKTIIIESKQDYHGIKNPTDNESKYQQYKRNKELIYKHSNDINPSDEDENDDDEPPPDIRLIFKSPTRENDNNIIEPISPIISPKRNSTISNLNNNNLTMEQRRLERQKRWGKLQLDYQKKEELRKQQEEIEKQKEKEEKIRKQKEIMKERQRKQEIEEKKRYQNELQRQKEHLSNIHSTRRIIVYNLLLIIYI